MKKKYLLKSSVFVAWLARLIAKAIDLFIALILSLFFYPVGIILSVAYIGISDSLQNGQSVGKRFMGLAVISLDDGTPCSVQQSVVRNLPFLVPMIFGILPFWGWIFTLGLGIPLLALEIYLIYGLDSGNRFGDVMADTTVMAINGDKETATRKTPWVRERSRPSPLHDSIQ